MVDPSRRRSVDSIGLRKLNQDVANRQPFAAPVARPSAPVSPAAVLAAPPAVTPTPPTKKPPKHRKRFYLLSSAASCLAVGTALAFFVSGQLHNKFSAASIAVSTVKASTDQAAVLKGQSQGRTNFLIYGMTKDGMRTDSIMLASYYYQQKKLVTINIPRDLYVYDGYENVKMGEVYAYAKLRQPHNTQYPDQFVSDLISKEYGVPVHYWVELNMQGEVSLVNSLGGVDVSAPDAFTDYEYPTWNYSGYIRPAPHFNAGKQHMNGDQALIYSRSRHSLDNNEGSDFARSKRQGLVLQAVMTKVKSQGILGNITQLSQYLTILNQNVTTSMTTDEMVSAAKLLKAVNPTTDHLIGNWSTGNGFLCDSTSTAGAYITLYGVPGNCKTEAGGIEDSPYREQAINYIKNLLPSVSPPPAPPAAAASTPGASTATTPAAPATPQP